MPLHEADLCTKRSCRPEELGDANARGIALDDLHKVIHVARAVTETNTKGTKWNAQEVEAKAETSQPLFDHSAPDLNMSFLKQGLVRNRDL